jgi:hypothetical protein
MIPQTATYRPGETVKVYIDPVSQTKPEGEAKLVEHLDNVRKLERWSVRFNDASQNKTFPRYIKAREQ